MCGSRFWCGRDVVLLRPQFVASLILANLTTHSFRAREASCPWDDRSLGGDSPLRLGYVDVHEQQIPKFGILKMA
jgi:hypothetical protein